MGIKGILPYIRKECPNAVKACSLRDLRGMKIAVDVSNFLYRFLYGGNVGSHIQQFGWLYVDLISNGIDPIFVFDGKAPVEKAEVREDREMTKLLKIEKVCDLYHQIEEKKKFVSPAMEVVSKEMRDLQEKFTSAKNGVINVTPKHTKDIKELLRLMGAKCVLAHSEAEATCALMNKLGQVDAVIAEDADVIAFGGLTLITGLGAKQTREKDMKKYDIKKVLEGLDVTLDQFIEMGILCKTDFTKNKKIRGIGPKTAHVLIKEFDTVENVIENSPKVKEVPDGFDPKNARTIFHSYTKRTTPFEYTLDIPTGTYDHETIIKFMKKKVKYPRVLASDWTGSLTGTRPPRPEHDSDDDHPDSVEDDKLWFLDQKFKDELEKKRTFPLPIEDDDEIMPIFKKQKKIKSEPTTVVNDLPPAEILTTKEQ